MTADTKPDRETIRGAIAGRRFSEPMKRALGRLLDGDSYRRAAEGEGVGYRDLHRNAQTVGGLRVAHLEAWRDYWGPAIAPAWKHHLRRLDDDLDVAG